MEGSGIQHRGSMWTDCIILFVMSTVTIAEHLIDGKVDCWKDVRLPSNGNPEQRSFPSNISLNVSFRVVWNVVYLHMCVRTNVLA